MTFELFGDFESRSEIDLNLNGLDRYARHPSTGVLMFNFAIGDGTIKTWVPANPRSAADMPAPLRAAIDNPEYIFIAHHAQFERAIFLHVLGIDIPIDRWRDTEVLAYSFSLPGKLEKIGPILRLPPEYCKSDGGELIKFFSIPAREQEEETLFGTVGRFNEPRDYPEKFAEFVAYGKQDVKTERYIYRAFNSISPLPQDEWENWHLDQEMNERGLPTNRTMVQNALELALESKKRDTDKLIQMTGLANPLSDAQMKEWLKGHKYPWNTLLAAYVDAELKNPNSPLTAQAKEVLKLRREAKKTSYTKLERILEVISDDDTLKYQFRFGGAARTLRWAGGDVQTQNLPRPIKAVSKNFQRAVDLIMAKDLDTITKDYPSVLGMVTSSLRMCFQAPAGKKMVISDLNAIENRGLGYLARCGSILKVFEEKKDPYISFAIKMYKQTYEELLAEHKSGKSEKRQVAKPAVLGSGYGLGAGARKNADGTYEYIMVQNEYGDLVHTGLVAYAKNMGITLTAQEAYEATEAFRKAYPEVVQYWKDLEEGFKRCFKTGKPVYIGKETYRKVDGRWQWAACNNVVDGAVLEITRRKMKFGYMIRIKLPSGRHLHYLNVSIEEETVKGKDGKPWTREVIYYDGIEHSATQNDDGSRAKKSYKWGRVKTYGGKLCENVVQAFCRDLLAYGMRLAANLGFELIGCFHDEIAALADNDPWGLTHKNLEWAMSQAPPYSPDMPVGAEGFESQFYRKN